jgi:mono/diheme cytochrome c family protein
MCAVAACAARSQPSRQELRVDLEASMTRHDWWAERLQMAVIAGDLPGVRVPGRWLATHDLQAVLRPGSQQHVERLRRLGEELARVEELADAGLLLGRVGETCGACHVEFGGPRRDPGAAPEGGPELSDRILRYAWAADRLWEGLIGPSDAAWREGAMEVCADPFTPERTPDILDRPELSELAEFLHEGGVEALLGQNRSDRPELYGRLIVACAACHRLSDAGGSV